MRARVSGCGLHEGLSAQGVNLLIQEYLDRHLSVQVFVQQAQYLESGVLKQPAEISVTLWLRGEQISTSTQAIALG